VRTTPAAVICGLLLAATGCSVGPDPQRPGPPAAAMSTPAPGIPAGGFADVVERVAPSVVTVRTTDGTGSGVVYRPDVVLTNEHVVAGASDVTVEFADGTSAPGVLLATDVVTDLAVVRTARADLPVPAYRTELPRPGDLVLAIGSPLGFENTVTAGIVSGLNRQIPGSAAQTQALVELIQTDAAISPGNSGGALVDAAGQVVGINEAYLPPATGAVSLGFAIPAATAVDVAEQLLADGTATHAFLGVTLGQLTSQIGRQLDVGVESGALVLSVQAGGPAAAAGLRPGDVVVALGGQQVGSVEDLLGALRNTEPGQQVPVEIVRDRQRQQLPVTVGSAPG
jgi:S1-C subfamily serine protease